MAIPARPVSPEALDEARRLYELTNVPVKQVADMLGIAKSTLSHRVRLWGWQPRKARIPLALPPPALPPTVEPVAAGAGAVAAGPPADRRELIARLVRRIETEIAAIERLVGRAGLNAAMKPEASHADGERAARTLAILVRSLRELAALEKAGAGQGRR
ncbi:hypothetical protein ACFSKM_17940 [Ancylobacter dichloromethanicus]